MKPTGKKFTAMSSFLEDEGLKREYQFRGGGRAESAVGNHPQQKHEPQRGVGDKRLNEDLLVFGGRDEENAAVEAELKAIDGGVQRMRRGEIRMTATGRERGKSEAREETETKERDEIDRVLDLLAGKRKNNAGEVEPHDSEFTNLPHEQHKHVHFAAD